MIDLNNNIKICDFGIGRILKNEKQMLYNLKFLDLYYKHRIPFIIIRSILDLIKRKREKKKNFSPSKIHRRIQKHRRSSSNK